MLKFLADENFHGDIVRGLRQRSLEIEFLRVQDVGLLGDDDPAILEWAANEDRILLTHDVTTVTRYAYERVEHGKRMPGVFEVPRSLPVGVAIEDLLLVADLSLEGEWENRVGYLPL